MNLFTRICRRLLWNTKGNGEIVGTLVAVGVCVVAGYAAVNAIGGKAQSTGQNQSNKIAALPGN